MHYIVCKGDAIFLVCQLKLLLHDAYLRVRGVQFPGYGGDLSPFKHDSERSLTQIFPPRRVTVTASSRIRDTSSMQSYGVSHFIKMQ